MGTDAPDGPPRPRRRVLLGLVLVLGVTVTATLVALSSRDDPLPPRADPPRLGVAVDVALEEPAAATTADVDAAAGIGADTLRVSVIWAAMEPLARGELATPYLRRLDMLMRRARERGLEVLLTPVYTPCWAAPPVPDIPQPCGSPAFLPRLQTLHPADPATYAGFVARLARRYRRVLAGIEVWNEPNLPGFWDQDDAVGDYAELVRATHRAVERVAPEVPIVAGVVAGADTDFIEDLHDEGIAGHYDVFSLHVYNDDRAPADRIDERFAAATFLQGLRAARRTFERVGEDRPIWITEMGWNTSTQRGRPFLDGVDAAAQAEYLEEALRMLEDPAERIDFASAILVYRLRDTAGGPTDPQANYGLMTRDRVPKPALDAVRRGFARARG